MKRKKEKANSFRGLERASLPSEAYDLAAKSRRTKQAVTIVPLQILSDA